MTYIYDEDREAEWWWDARRPLYVQLYRAAALKCCGTCISILACWGEGQDACEHEGRAAMLEASVSCAPGGCHGSANDGGDCDSSASSAGSYKPMGSPLLIGFDGGRCVWRPNCDDGGDAGEGLEATCQRSRRWDQPVPFRRARAP